MDTIFDRTKTLEQLENSDWSEPEYDSYLVTTMYRLRRKPINEFTVEDLRIMIGQHICLRYLIPLAIERLSEDPLVAGDFYRGDLLKNVLSIQPDFWREHPEFYWDVEGIIVELENLRDAIDSQLIPVAQLFRAVRPDR
jgi:hypothetical protein